MSSKKEDLVQAFEETAGKRTVATQTTISGCHPTTKTADVVNEFRVAMNSFHVAIARDQMVSLLARTMGIADEQRRVRDRST